MRIISEAANRYKEDRGFLPKGTVLQTRETLIQEGYLEDFPTPSPSILSRTPGNYVFISQYDNMDPGTRKDAVIAIWRVKDEFCKEFNHYYSSNSSGPTIYDWEAAGQQYPGQTIGTHMTIYALKWESDAVDDCEIQWVVEYR